MPTTAMIRVPPSRSPGAYRALVLCLALLAAAAVLAASPGTDFSDSFEAPFPNSTWQVSINGTNNKVEARVPLADATAFRPPGPWDGMMALRVQYGGSSGSAQAEAAAVYPGGTLSSASLRLMLYVPSATTNAFPLGSQVRIARLMSDKSDSSADLALFMVRGSSGGMFLQGEYRTTLGPVRIGAVDKTGIASDTWHTVELQFVNSGLTGDLSLYVDDAQLPRDGTTGLSLLSGSSFGAVGVGLSGLASSTSTGTVAWWMDDVTLSSGFNGHAPPRIHFHQDGYETPNVSARADPPGKSLVDTSGGSVAHVLLGHRDGGMEADDQTTAAAVSAAYGELRGMDPTTKVFHRVWWRQGTGTNLGSGHPLMGITSSGLTGVSTGAVKLPMAALSLTSTGAVALWGYSQTGGVASRDPPVTLSGALGPGWHLLELEVAGAGTTSGQRRMWVDGQLAPASPAVWPGVVPTQWVDGHLPDDQTLSYVGRDDYDDSRTSAGSQPSQLTVLGGTADVNAGACTPITIQVIDSFGGLAAPPEDVPVSYNAGGAGSFFTDGTCTTAVTVLPVPSGVSTVQPFFMATGTPGSVTLTLSSPDYLSRNSTLRILSGTPGDTTPPSVPGPAVPAALWNRAPVVVTWTGSRDNIGGSGLVGYDVQVSQNDGGWAPWRTVPAIIPGADSGIVFDGGESFWRLRVTARDDAGNVSAPGLESPLVTMDFTPPDQPGTPSGTLLGGGLASVTWQASGDPGPAPSGVASYTLAVTDLSGTTSLFPGLTTNSYPSLPVSSNQTYRMVVTASDRAGNASSPSAEGRLVVTGPTARLRLLGVGPFAVMDDNYPVTVEAVDDAGYVTIGYQGAVSFTATLSMGGPASATLPSDGGPYQFAPADLGRHRFDAGFAFHAVGDVTAVVSDVQGLGQRVPVTVISTTDVRIVHDARLLATSGVPYLYNAAGRVRAVSGDLRLTYSACGGPSEFLVDANTGAVSWTPANGNQVVDLCVQARTSGGASDSYPFQVTVQAASALPSATFTVTPDHDVAGTPALFDPTGSTVSVPEPAYRWRFGDGSPPGFRDRPLHAYLLPGGYRPALTLFDGLGQSAYAAVPVRWKDGQGRDPPSVSIQTGPLEAKDRLDVTLVADVRNGLSPVSAQWDLGNGAGANGTSASTTYRPGRYWATASAVDSSGLPATDKVEIAVSRDDKVPPHCLAAADPVVAFIGSGTSVKVDWLGIVSPGSRPLTSVTWNVDGTPSLTAATSRTYSTTGWHHGALTVVDEEGLRCTDTVAVLVVGPGDTVASAPPRILDPGLDGTSVCGQEYTGRAALASGSGPFTWSLPASAQGMTADAATGVLHWTPPPVPGVDHSTYVLQVQGPAGTDKVSVDLPYSCPDSLSLNTLCGCGAGGGGPAAAGLIALGLWALRARARRRR